MADLQPGKTSFKVSAYNLPEETQASYYLKTRFLDTGLLSRSPNFVTRSGNTGVEKLDFEAYNDQGNREVPVETSTQVLSIEITLIAIAPNIELLPYPFSADLSTEKIPL